MQNSFPFSFLVNLGVNFTRFTQQTSTQCFPFKKKIYSDNNLANKTHQNQTVLANKACNG